MSRIRVPHGQIITPASAICSSLNGAVNLYFNWLTIDADLEKNALVMPITKTGSITDITTAFASITTGGTLNVRLETVDSNGNPSGTLWATDTSGTINPGSADDNDTITCTLTAAASVTRGDWVAVVIERPSGGAFVGNIAISSSIYCISNEYSLTHSGSGYATAKWRMINSGLVYSDGDVVFPRGALPWGQDNPFVTQTCTAGYQYGNVIYPIFSGVIDSVVVLTENDVSADWVAKIYRPSDLTNAAASSGQHNYAIRMLTTGTSYYTLDLTTPLPVVRGEKLFAVIQPVTTNREIYKHRISASSHYEYVDGDITTSLVCSRNGTTGSFTEDSTYRMYLALAYSHIDIDAGRANFSMGI